MDTRPIGVLDSGVGGLTIWQEIVKQLPNEPTIYIGDSQNVPYGNKSQDEILRLASRMLNFLQEKQVKLIVVACNTITVSGIGKLRLMFPDTPIIGTVPVIKTAAQVTKKGKIGVLSTTATANSDYQRHIIELYAPGIEVINRGTDRLVPLIEKGQTEGQEVEAVLIEELQPFSQAGADVIALGCTHFPFLRNSMQSILGEGVTLLDSGAAVARQVRRILENNEAFADGENTAHQLFTTGNEDTFRMIVAKTGIDAENIEFTTLV